MVRQRVSTPRKTDITNDITDAAGNIWDAINYQPADPQDDLVNVPGFDDWYMTPDDPVDPRDCNRYPNSPWCGGTGFSPTPIDFGIDWVADDCNFGVQACPTLAFVSLPCFQIVHRNPACKSNIPDPPYTPLQPNTSQLVPIPPHGCNIDRDSIAVLLVLNTYKHGESFIADKYGLCEAEISIETTIDSFELFYPEIILKNANDKIIYSKVTLTSTVKVYHNLNWIERYIDRYGNPAPPQHFTETITTTQIYDEDTGVGDTVLDHGQLLIARTGSFVSFDFRAWIYNAEGLQIIQNGHDAYNNYTNRNYINPITDNFGHVRGSQYESFNYTVQIKCGTNTYPSNYAPPPPLPPDKNKDKDCCMCCNNGQNDDALLKLLYKKVNQLSKVIGVDDYPVSLPKSLITKHGEFTGNKQLNTLVNALDDFYLGNQLPDDLLSNSKDIPSLTQLFGWYIERFDEVMGQFEIPIEIKDSDPTTPGDQPVGFRLPNIAESIAEMMMLLLNITMNSETLVNMQTRTAIEVAQDKQQNFKNYLMTQAIVDYLGFKHKEEKHKLPMMYHLGKENLDEFLKESEAEVVGIEYNDKQNYQETLHRLLEAAAITKAVHYRKVDINGDVKQQIMDIIKGYSRTNKKINSNKDDFDTFLEDAERGFTNTDGITDSQHPYGRNYDERPRIREIGNTSDPN